MSRSLANVLVALQFLLLIALIVEPRGTLWAVGFDPVGGVFALLVAAILGLAGGVLAVLGVVGLGPALTASPIPRERAALVTHGVYGLMRNPIYTGLMIGGLGLAAFGASWWHLATWLALVILLALKGRWEERMLAARHPDFAEYAHRVGRFLPGIGRWPSDGA